MIFVLVIWSVLIFVPVKKSLKNIPVKKKLFEKGLWPHQNVEVAWFCHVAVANCATFATWHAT